MLCTNCSKEIKPVVALDIDGTLGDFHSHFISFAQSYLGYGPWDRRNWEKGTHQSVLPRKYNGVGSFRNWCCSAFNISPEVWYDIKLAYRQGAQKRSMPIYEGAAELTRWIREGDAELWLTTTRPYLRLDNIDPDTRAWCDRHGIIYDHMIYDEDKYKVLGELVGRERVVVVVDDLKEMCTAAGFEFGPHVPIQRLTEWNRGEAYHVGVTSLGKELKGQISRRVRNWWDRMANEALV